MLTVWVNTGTQDLELNDSGAEFVEFSENNDRLLFSAGSDIVVDGASIPTQSELISAGIRLTGNQIIVDKYFLEDVSENEIDLISLMGNVDAQYVLAFDFDDETASEPVLEVYDDSDLDSIDSVFLGAGTPSASFVRGITTTAGSSGVDWATGGGATKMAGSGNGNFLYLNNQLGPLTGADTLYANLAVIVPASQTQGFSANPAFVCKFLSV